MERITLPARCDRAAALALHGEFVAALGSQRMDVDGRDVEQVGLAMLQVLASAKAGFPRFDIAASEPLREAAQLAGLGAHLFGEDAQ